MSSNTPQVLNTAQDVASFLMAKNEAKAPDASQDETPQEEDQDAPELEGEEGEQDLTSEGDDQDALAAEEAADATDHEGEEDAGEESPAIEAPASWPKDRADEWASLPEHIQKSWVERDQDLHRAKSEAGREAAEARRKADEAVNRSKEEYSSKVRQIEDLLPKVQAAAKSRWEAIDWKQLAADDPEQYVALKAAREEETEAINKAAAEARAKQSEDLKAYQLEQYQSLIDRNPQYAGETGQKALAAESREVEAFARKLPGVTDDMLNTLSSEVYEVLRDAWKYRNASKTATKPAKQPAPKTVKPSPRPSSTDVAKKTLEAKKNDVRTARGRNQQDAALAQFLLAKKKA